MSYFKLLHLLSVLVWVGGMFFAYVVLRPAAVDVLQPPERLRLWANVFQRFFKWVWVAIGSLFVTGLYMIYQYGGMGHVPGYVHAMLTLGTVMTGIYLYVYFACYVPLTLKVKNELWKEAGTILGKIRTLVGLNLALGIITISVVKIATF